MITLAKDGFEAVIDPEKGGALTRFAAWGEDVMRPTPKTGYDVGATACFPLVPYANRIANGLLQFQGRTIRLVHNFGDHPHSLHGHGWQRAWRVEALSGTSATLAYDYAPADWPWAYSAEQSFALDGEGLTIGLALRNRDSKEMPFSLGLHPYFPRRPETVLTAKIAGMWEADATMLPTVYVTEGLPIDLAAGVNVAEAPFVDNCFPGWQAPARIDQAGLSVLIDASPDCTFLHCYMPEGKDFFAAEPVTAMPNAFDRPEPAAVTGMRVLKPGESHRIEMRLAVRRR